MTFATTDQQPAAWCVGGPDRPPHTHETARPRGEGLPRCEPCELRRLREGGRQ